MNVRENTSTFLEIIENSWETTKYTIRLKETRRKRDDSHYYKEEYTYDKWGNVRYNIKTMKTGEITNTSRLWAKYYAIPFWIESINHLWKSNPYDLPSQDQLRYNLLEGLIIDTNGWITKYFGVVFLHVRIDIAFDPSHELDKPEPGDCGPYAQENLEEMTNILYFVCQLAILILKKKMFIKIFQILENNMFVSCKKGDDETTTPFDRV